MIFHKISSFWSLVMLAVLAGCHAAPLTGGGHVDPLSYLPWSHHEEEAVWNQWAAAHLQSGDVVFVRGDSRIVFGLVNFSQLCTEVADSRFSHVALVACEKDGVWVYDVVMGGPRRVTFGKFATDRRISQMAVKRLQPKYQRYVPAALEYCRQECARGGKFDTEFKLNNEQYYCSELVEQSFRHAGLPLSRPVRIADLPHIDRLSATTRTLIGAMTTIDMQQELFLPGNDQIGLWSCPYLDLVADGLAPQGPADPGAASPMTADLSRPADRAAL